MTKLIKKTRKAWNEPGHAHFLTYSCVGRLALLSTARTRTWVIQALEQTRRRLDIDLWAYVIMPEHVHLVLCPRQPDYEMRRILVQLKRPVADAARQHLEDCCNESWLERLRVRYPSRTVFRFWQPGGGFDHNIFKQETLETVMDYVHANPVRRGLADVPTDWAWSSARFWNGATDTPIRMDHPNF